MNPIPHRSKAHRPTRRALAIVFLFGTAFFPPAAAAPPATVDTGTLAGKVLCGYQGWFNCPGDGMDLGWTHWARDPHKPFGPGNVSVDLWPDVSELDPDERFATGFTHADGRPAEVFSSANRKTVLRHFHWMRDYGIDGVFLQRFANGLTSAPLLAHKDAVLSHVRDAARQAGRAYAVMYDLSGLRAGATAVVRDDWRTLRTTLKVTEDPAYLRHDGRPVVAVWGIGFAEPGDRREYTLAECRDLVAEMKEDGCTVMLGVPTGWRRGDRDATADPLLHEILKLADVVSPWTVGRYRTPGEVARHAESVLKNDLAWCDEHGLDYLPVVFPGFSWHHLRGGELGAISRLKGDFLWAQLVSAARAGCRMIYVAMFDEVDEGTAIFKCTNAPPTGDGISFLTYDGLPSDHYLRLAGLGGKLLRGELPLTETMPAPAPGRFGSPPARQD